MHPKIWRPKPYLQMFTSGRFGQVLPAAVHSADCRFDSGVKWWIQVQYIVTYLHKNSFLGAETVTNKALNRQHVVFDRLWANAAPTLNTAFSLTNVHAKWWIYCLLIASTPLLSLANSIYDRPKWVWVFWCFPGQLLNLGNLSIQQHLCLYDCL